MSYFSFQEIRSECSKVSFAISKAASKPSLRLVGDGHTECILHIFSRRPSLANSFLMAYLGKLLGSSPPRFAIFSKDPPLNELDS